MDTAVQAAKQYRVGFLLVDGFALMSYASALEPLRAANLLAQETYYAVQNIAVKGTEARSSSGACVPCVAIDRVGFDFDLVVVVAGGDPVSFHDPVAFTWLRLLSRRDVMLGGVSGGPVILALAKLMGERRMTVHWEHAEALLELVPNVRIERTLYIFDRDRMTCAGGMAALDMTHALIEYHHGADFACKVSDWFLHTEIRPAAGPQRGGLVARHGTTNVAVTKALEVMENHLSDPLDLPQLAELAGISVRQLNRLFQDKLGCSTMVYYRQMRLEKSQSLLLQSSLSISDIAYATGFANSTHFSRAYREVYHHSPSAARKGIKR